jgi:hypothetical protein
MATDMISQAPDTQAIDRSLFLRRTLQGNALFSTASGLLFLFGREAVAALLGLSSAAASVIAVLSIGLFVWAGLTLWVSTRTPIQRYQVFAIIGGDLLWVIGSILLLLGGWLPLSTAGMWAVGIVADIVALFAILQFIGWRRMKAGTDIIRGNSRTEWMQILQHKPLDRMRWICYTGRTSAEPMFFLCKPLHQLRD